MIGSMIKKKNIAKAILEYMGGKRYIPLGQRALFETLQLPEQLFTLFKEVISSLIRDGTIVLKKKQLHLKGREKSEISGIIKIHPRGFGFVQPEDRERFPLDIFIPKPFTENAVDSDYVKVELFENRESPKGPEGRVIEILDRGRKSLVGTVINFTEMSSKSDKKTAIAYVPLLGPSKSVHVKNCPKTLKIGDRLLLKVKKWENGQDYTITEIIKKLAPIERAKADIPIAILEYGLKEAFPAKVVAEAKKFGTRVKTSEVKERVDLTDQPCFTIDPTTAKDFDDALCVQKHSGGYELFVHIADVAHYVKEGTALDKEAKTRGNSTYFPNQCIPMLPEELSNNLCSLKEKVVRLVATVHVSFDPEGNLISHKVFRSAIKSRKRFTYEEAFSILENKEKSPFKKDLELMVELCLLLKKKRQERGSVDLALPEFVLTVDKEGEPTGYSIVEYDITHQMVEEFMLKANEVVATHLTNEGKGAIFRIHEIPSDENLQDFFNLARLYGFQLSDKPTTEEISALFQEAKESPHGKQLSVAFIRSMKLAYYSPNNVGHYGLALENYCHFTSPIRRYSDLIIERLLFDEVQTQNLAEVSLLCSEKERLSFRAEQSVLTLKKYRLLKYLSKKRKPFRLKATVSKIKPFGFFFEIDPLMLEGFIHISRIGSDYYEFDSQDNTLIGDHTGESYHIGTKIEVELIHLDLIMQTTEWRLIRKSRG